MKKIKMEKWKKTLLKSLTMIAAILIAHGIILCIFSQVDIISKGFSAGGLKQPLILAAVTAFVVLRFLAVLLLPGIVLACAGMVVFDYLCGRRKSEPEPSEYFK